MIANITNIDSHVSGEALLPFFNSTVEIELDSDSQEDIGFAERQLAFLSALPVETYVRLCRHSVDYAADLVDYVGEYLGMFDEEEFQDEIIPSNFHHIWPAVQQDLEENALHILRFARLLNIRFDRLLNHGEEVLAANLEFDCDWEPEHGMVWSIINPILRGEAYMMIWKKSSYKLMTGKWKIGILLEAGYEVLETIEKEEDYIKLGDRIYFHAGPLANHSSQMLLPEETEYFCEGLRMVSKSLNHVLSDNSCLSIAIHEIQFSDCAIQNEAFTACAIQWASEIFQFPMPDIPVVFDLSQGISGAYSFDFSMVKDR